ncbi:hypothetical protein QPL79_08475 [Ignisphaera sp. 4213-co]|uniref:Tripartite tricarboxylate transporter TctB family protein n=1 Tax=Ignisphaera cupida TaxID=3050454 RepID=A0ABD4Z7T2_9CREN|nr:hypothetical protein [Ignisphaera sp. 4213-co]MDK6029396.1 hypothetical protein [Ignisphaera sp. 4213-co]
MVKSIYVFVFALFVIALALSSLLYLGPYSYTDFVAIYTIYALSLYFIMKTAIAIKSGKCISISFKIPFMLIDIRPLFKQIHRVLLFSVLTMIFGAFTVVFIKNIWYSSTLSALASITATYFLSKYWGRTLQIKVLPIAIVLIAIAFYVAGFISDKAFYLDDWIKFFEAMLQ